MSTKLNHKQKMEIVYTYAFSTEHLSMSTLAEEYGVCKQTISKTLHNFIETLQVSRSVANIIRNKAISNIKNTKRQSYKIIESFDKSIMILEEKILVVKNRLDYISDALYNSQDIESFQTKQLLKEYDELYKLYTYIIQ